MASTGFRSLRNKDFKRGGITTTNPAFVSDGENLP
jgi:hypothetical protein